MEPLAADVEVIAQLAPHIAAVMTPVPCAARPSTTFAHVDGPCRCFFGGPAPEFGTADQHRRAHLS